MNPFEISKNDGVGGHNEWLTPPYILEKLGPFDLDPCSPVNPPWKTAEKMYNINDDGLSQPWEGYVWLNPPYGKEANKWMSKMREHNNGIALLVARTETINFHENVWPCADGILFFRKRLKFHKVDGTVAGHTLGCPSVLVGYGPWANFRLKEAFQDFSIDGYYINLDHQRRYCT